MKLTYAILEQRANQRHVKQLISAVHHMWRSSKRDALPDPGIQNLNGIRARAYRVALSRPRTLINDPSNR
jgi:hypothetical protein